MASLRLLPLFCRHNRHTAECPICSKGTVLDSSRPAARSSGSSRPRKSREAAPPPTFKGPYASVGPYQDDAGEYEVRLERVPGGLRLAAWSAGSIRRTAPVLGAGDLGTLLLQAAERGVLGDDAERLLAAAQASEHGSAQGEAAGASGGRAGELRDELRVEALADGRVRVARWMLRPNHGWQLQEAPVMLPGARYAEAVEAAAAAGALASG
jgi:hypothetical protein